MYSKCLLALSAPRYFYLRGEEEGGEGGGACGCWGDPDRKMVFDIKFGTFILCNVMKKNEMVEKNFQNCSHSYDHVTNLFVNLFEKLCEKWLKCVF